MVGGDTEPREDRVFDNGGCTNHGSMVRRFQVDSNSLSSIRLMKGIAGWDDTAPIPQLLLCKTLTAIGNSKDTC